MPQLNLKQQYIKCNNLVVCLQTVPNSSEKYKLTQVLQSDIQTVPNSSENLQTNKTTIDSGML